MAKPETARFVVDDRKAVQIAVAAVDDPGGQYTVVALCNDGTMWSLWRDGVQWGWSQLPRIPQT